MTIKNYKHNKNRQNGEFKETKKQINQQRKGTPDPLGQQNFQEEKHQQIMQKQKHQQNQNNSPRLRLN